MGVLDAAQAYAKLGLRIVPLNGKVPKITSWQTTSSSAAEQIAYWWKRYDNPEGSLNVGVQLGPRSNIVDIECDSLEAETALAEMFGEDPPVVPTFRASRGCHRIFLYDARLPPQSNVKLDGVEFRIGGGDKGAQSVFPPSIHHSGVVYTWLPGLSLDDTPPGTLPEHIVQRLIAEFGSGEEPTRAPRAKGKKIRATAEVVEGGRNDTAAKLCGDWLQKLADPMNDEACAGVLANLMNWNLARNKPPLDEKELTTVFNSILRSHRAQVEAKKLDDFFEPDVQAIAAAEADVSPAVDTENQGVAPEPAAPKAHDPANGWKVVIVESIPRSYKLYSPRWHNVRNGYVVIQNAKDWNDPKRIIQEVLCQTDVQLSNATFNDIWLGSARGDGYKGLQEILIERREFEAAPSEVNREMVTASKLREALLFDLRTQRPDQDLSKYGDPQRIGEDIYFSFDRVWAPMRASHDKILRGELSDVVRKAGILSHYFKIGATRHPRHVATPTCMAELDRMCCVQVSAPLSTAGSL